MGVGANVVTIGAIILGLMSLVQTTDRTDQDRLQGLKGTDGQARVEVLKLANRVYDWPLALQLWEEIDSGGGTKVLGSSTELDALADPRKPIFSEIEKWERLTESQPSRYGYMRLARLYKAVFAADKAEAAWMKGVEIDPNDYESTNEVL